MNIRLAFLLFAGIVATGYNVVAQTMINIETSHTALILETDADSAGEQYRLQDPYKEKVTSMAYVNSNKDEAIVFNYYVATTYTTTIGLPIKMKGLAPDRQYKIEEINVYPGTKSTIDSTKTYSGDFLMNIGFNPEVSSRRTSVVLKVTAI